MSDSETPNEGMHPPLSGAEWHSRSHEEPRRWSDTASSPQAENHEDPFVPCHECAVLVDRTEYHPTVSEERRTVGGDRQTTTDHFCSSACRRRWTNPYGYGIDD